MITKGQALIMVAASQDGIKESPPNSNRVKYSAWYGYVGPWCAMFYSWLSHALGLSFHYMSVPAAVLDARRKRNDLTAIERNKWKKVKAGYGVTYNWNPGDGIADHIGSFVKWEHPGSSFWAWEGNTSAGNDSNGGEVQYRLRYLTNVECFIKQAGIDDKIDQATVLKIIAALKGSK
jgi:hypothetical protein